MKKSMRFTALLAGVMVCASAAQADPIEGKWKRPNGIIVKMAACGDSFCATAVTGAHAGGSAGKLHANGSGGYAGTLTDLENGKTYTGKGSVKGDTLVISGCVLGGLLCRSENWTKQ